MQLLARALLILAAGGVLGSGVLASSPAYAWAQPCQVGSLSVSSSLNPEATAYKPGVWVQRPATVINRTGADLTDGRFNFIIGPNSQKMGTRPSVRWNIDGGSWHMLSFFRTNIGMPVWRSDDNALPTIADGSRHTLRFSVAFASGSTQGSYFTQLNIGSASCSLTWLGGTYNMSFGFLPSYAPKTAPAASSPRPRASLTRAAAAPVSPLASASPSASSSAYPEPVSAIAAPSTSQTLPLQISASHSTTQLPVIAGLAAATIAAFAVPVAVMRRRRTLVPSRSNHGGGQPAGPVNPDIG